MGNTVSEAGQIKTTDLGNFIKNWALNDYTPDKTYENQMSIKYSLKKRACCINQKTMPIALPSIDNSSTTTPKTLLLSSVQIPIFKDQAELDSGCVLPITSTTSADYKYTSLSTDPKVISITSGCANIYDFLCPKIRADKKATGDMATAQLYSRNPDSGTNGKPSTNVLPLSTTTTPLTTTPLTTTLALITIKLSTNAKIGIIAGSITFIAIIITIVVMMSGKSNDNDDNDDNDDNE